MLNTSFCCMHQHVNDMVDYYHDHHQVNINNQALILYIFHISASHYTLYRKLETTPKNNSENYRILFRHIY